MSDAQVFPMHEWFEAEPKQHERGDPFFTFAQIANAWRPAWTAIVHPNAEFRHEDLVRAREALRRNDVPRVTFQTNYGQRTIEYAAMVEQIREDLDLLRRPLERMTAAAYNTYTEPVVVGGREVLATFRPTG